MSILIDDLIRKETGHTSETYITANTYKSDTKKSKYYLAKPLTILNWQEKIKRLIGAYRVLIGKSFAVHYKEEE
jgi:hypothetical protein